MGSNVKIQGLKEALEEIVRERVQKAASKIADELTVEAGFSIVRFYTHYSPIYYRGQGGLSDTYTRYYRNPHNVIYYGGVELHPGSGSYSGWSGGRKVSVGSDFVSALAVFNGMHGNVEAFPHAIKNVPPRMPQSPFELVNKKKDEIINNIDSYVN